MAKNSTGGELYIDLGNISEDIQRDGRKFFENGLPKDLEDDAQETDTTAWGVIPTTQSVVNAFAIVENNSNAYQDVGMDGLASTQTDLEGRNEQEFFAERYLNLLNPGARARWESDPSNDDYRFFRGDAFDA
nr:hypothetical protein [Flavobacteriales bacterium]